MKIYNFTIRNLLYPGVRLWLPRKAAASKLGSLFQTQVQRETGNLKHVCAAKDVL